MLTINPPPNSTLFFPLRDPTHSHHLSFHRALCLPMAVSGFEGFEKRLELHFFGDDPMGLRRLSFKTLDHILAAVQCGVVSAVGNDHFDAYVLSESSLFLYPEKLVIKTCGTTGLLHSIPLLLHHAAALGLKLLRCKYTRGSFIFPSAQPAPHTSFKEEVLFLEKSLPASLRHRKARILPSHSSRHKWHVYSASSIADNPVESGGPITVEVCMTELDRAVANRFFRWPGEAGMTGHEAGREMTRRAGIAEAAGPRAFICDFAFDPCGYSMNGLHADRYSTIHVTPEEGYSYASYEFVVTMESEIESVLNKVNAVFRPGVMSVSVTGGPEEWIEIAGLTCRSRAAEAFSGAGIVTYQTYVSGRNGVLFDVVSEVIQACNWDKEGERERERERGWMELGRKVERSGEWERHDVELH